MRINGRATGESVVLIIRRVLAENPDMTRRGISKRVCEELGLRSENGRYQEVSCRKALLKLERQGEIRLPEARGWYFSERAKRTEASLIEAAEVECEISGLGEIAVRPVSSRDSKDSRIWNELMERNHYLGKGPLLGAQIRYLVESNGIRCLLYRQAG